jgi:ribonucleoside-diphosphate reductase alpha chain
LAKDENGRVIETPEEMFRRVAKHVASAEKVFHPDLTAEELKQIEDTFYHLMASLDFLPNSPTLMNAGKELGQLSACFVLPIDDSMEGIFDAIKNTALIHKSGGGTGFSFSRLRPKDSMVRSTAGTASGPVSFMNVFNAATETVKQGGTRRGANMAILRVDHPDIEQFIDCKKGEHSLNNFNISVAVTDEFMDAVKNGLKFTLRDPRTGEGIKEINASKLFDKIVENAWRNGEPGIVFLDQVNRSNPTPELGEIESTNPCGEQPLLPYESCNLGSINLDHVVEEDQINWDKLERLVKLSVRFLDDVIEVNRYPLPQIEEVTRANRKIGLGVMGYADLLFQLEVPYNSADGIKLGEEIMEFIQKTSHRASAELAEHRGVFPNFDKSFYETPMRNATVTTIAPTGTLSMIADCSGGIEPVFSLVYVKRVMDGQDLRYVNRHFEKALDRAGIRTEKLLEKIAGCRSLEEVDEIPEPLRRVFVTSHEIAPEWHVRMQAAFQKYTDNAVSKTINFPHNATTGDVRKAYMLAYDLGCKGLTVYRDGSRQEQVMHKGKTVKGGEKDDGSPYALIPRKRPAVTRGMTERVNTGDGPIYITINEDGHGICEVFTSIGKAGGNMAAQAEAISRLISLALRAGIDPREIIKHLKGIAGPNPIWENGTLITSGPDAIAKAMERYLQRRETNSGEKSSWQPVDKVIEKDTNLTEIPDQCPDCGDKIEHEEGCLTCRSCGWTKCG